MAAATRKSNELRVKFPPNLLEQFAENPRILLKIHEAGIWPIAPAMLQKMDWKKLARNREFNAQFEVVIMPKN